MKKAYACILLALAICCAFFAVRAEESVGDDNAFLTCMAILRQEGASSFSVQTTRDYFASLKADDFRLLRRLALKAGAAEPSLQYTQDGKLLFSGVRWQTPRAFDCGSWEEAATAMVQCMQNGLDSFQLICDDALLRRLIDESGIYSCAAAAGIEDLSVRYDWGSGVIYAEDVTVLDLPWARAGNTDQFILAAEAFFKNGDGRFCIAFDPEFYAQLQQDPETERMMLALSQMETWQSVTRPGFCRTEYYDVTYSDAPRMVCRSRQDITDTVQQMGIIGANEFRLILPPELFEAVTADGFNTLHRLEAEGGMTASDLRYSPERCILFYSNASIRADARQLNTVSEAAAYLEEAAAREERQITLFLRSDLYALLLRGIMYETPRERGMAPIYDLIAAAGIFDYSFTHSAVTGIIQLEVTAYYPGTKLLHACREGREDTLTAREQETLAAARRMAEACADPDPRTAARKIHDMLCASVVYTVDDASDEDDTAVGALLNGQANCDGYSDAFYLAGSLCGLEVRCQHGDTLDSEAAAGPQAEEGTHMWNLLLLDGMWRAVDVTWDDDDGELPRYTWFDIGQDRLDRSHIRNPETALPLLPVTDAASRPRGEYMVADTKEALIAVRTALDLRLPVFSLVYTDAQAAAGHDLALQALRQIAPSSFSWSWDGRMDELRITGLKY